MNSTQYPYNFAPMAQAQQLQQMFPQPQGSVYSINAPVDIGNVPIGSTGLSVAICFNEQIMYIKSFQNGSPVIMAYRIAPYSKESSVPAATEAPAAENASFANLAARLETLEQALSKITNTGGSLNGLL